MNYTFGLKELHTTYIAYFHHQEDMSLIPSSIRKLMRWTGAKGFINGPTDKLILVYQHERRELSVDIDLTVPQEVGGENETSKGLLSGGLYAIGHLEIGTNEIPAAWSLMYTPTSEHRRKLCAGKPFEIYQSISLDQHPQDKCMIDLCIPIRMIDLKLIEEKIIFILTECDAAIFASITQEGCPCPVPMGKIETDSISQIQFSIGTFSDKAAQFQPNLEAGACFTRGGDSIVLTGKVETVSDMGIKRVLWSDQMFAHLPGGVIDPNYCILKFTSEETTYWIDNEFIKVSI